MSTTFNPRQGLIMVGAELFGPSGSAVLRFALDTGATSTIVNVGLLVAIGYDPALASKRVQVTTGSGVEFVPRIKVDRMVVLGQEPRSFPVLCHTLPPSASVDGLTGLDFLRGHCLTVDFCAGRVTIV